MLYFFSKSSIVDYIERRNFLDSIVENRNYKYSHTYLNSCFYACVLRVWDCRRLWLITKENLSIELRRQRIFKKSVLCPKHTIYFWNSIRILFWTQFIENTWISMNVRHYLVFHWSIASKNQINRFSNHMGITLWLSYLGITALSIKSPF